jgi:hypothetical protein
MGGRAEARIRLSVDRHGDPDRLNSPVTQSPKSFIESVTTPRYAARNAF